MSGEVGFAIWVVGTLVTFVGWNILVVADGPDRNELGWGSLGVLMAPLWPGLVLMLPLLGVAYATQRAARKWLR